MQKLPIFTAVRLPTEQAHALKALAVQAGCTESELHRRALASFLAAQVTVTRPPTEVKHDFA